MKAKGVEILDTAKKYLPSIGYTLITLVILFAAYKFFIRLKSSSQTLGSVVADKLENSQLSKATGINESRIAELRNIAYDLSRELETNVDMTSMEKMLHIQLDRDTIRICKRIETADEMVIVKNFYNNLFTKSDLKSDLDDVIDGLTGYTKSDIPYYSAL